NQQGYANPASQHQAGRRARRVLEDARDAIGELLGADLTGRQPDRVIFTSGGTEANNLAILGLAEAGGAEPGEVITSAIEHPSVQGPLARLESQGWVVHRVGVTRDGAVRAGDVEPLINDRTRLITVMLGNNETGVLQPVADIARIAAVHGVPMHTDGVQVVGKLPVSFDGLRVTSLSLAGHKFHGPPGIGALVVAGGTRIAPQLFGGFQQAGLRPGTESVALAVGLRTALEMFQTSADSRAQRMRELRNRLESALKAGFAGTRVNGAGAPRLPHTSNLAFLGLDRQALAMALDLAGVACSTGSACASGSSEPSHVLLAMGCEREVVASSLRFSLGAETTADEIDEAIRRILATTANLLRQAQAERTIGAASS
ncbi:MAG TPA: cysteine desulfurase family protein, partial [Pirellulales bacterium]|nr:cysteine desulfurase family protein [Pirellulales bacterium]